MSLSRNQPEVETRHCGLAPFLEVACRDTFEESAGGEVDEVDGRTESVQCQLAQAWLEQLTAHPPGSSAFEPLILERLCSALQLGVVDLMIVQLKVQLDQRLNQERGGVTADAPVTRLMDSAATIREVDASFSPDCAAIWQALRSRVEPLGWTQARLETELLTLVRQGLHHVDWESPERNAARESFEREHLALSAGTAEQHRQFFGLKRKWSMQLTNWESMLSIHESLRIKVAHAKAEYLQSFADLFLELREAEYRKAVLRAKVAAFQENPNATAEQLNQAVAAAEAEFQRAMEAERNFAVLAPYMTHGPTRTLISPEAQAEYLRELNAIRKRIYLMICPDRVAHTHPHLTDQQKEELAQLMRDVNALVDEVGAEEVGYSSDQLGHSMRSLEAMLRKEAAAQTILSNAGVNVNTTYMVMGQTIEERIAWLERETNWLSADIQRLRGEARDFERERQQFAAAMDISPEQHRQQLETETRAVIDDCEALERTLEAP